MFIANQIQEQCAEGFNHEFGNMLGLEIIRVSLEGLTKEVEYSDDELGELVGALLCA
jgi:hypothetical protein